MTTRVTFSNRNKIGCRVTQKSIHIARDLLNFTLVCGATWPWYWAKQRTLLYLLLSVRTLVQVLSPWLDQEGSMFKPADWLQPLCVEAQCSLHASRCSTSLLQPCRLGQLTTLRWPQKRPDFTLHQSVSVVLFVGLGSVQTAFSCSVLLSIACFDWLTSV